MMVKKTGGMTMRYWKFGVLALLFSFSFSFAGSTIVQSHSTAQLVSNVDAVADNHSFWALLHIKTSPGWHAYWKNPGDSGIPPSLKWSLPGGMAAGKMVFQPPHRIVLGDLANYGYDDNAYYLTPISVKNSERGEKSIKVHAEWLVCEKECIPQAGDFTFPINVAEQTKLGPKNQFIQSLIKKLPKRKDQPLSYSTTEKNIIISMPESITKQKIQSAYFFPEEESVILPGFDQVLSKTQDGMTLTMARDFSVPADSLHGVLLLKTSDGDQYIDIKVNKESVVAPADSIWQAILFALLGGIILNAMPCVFPILALKALSISKSGTQSYRHNVLDGVSYTMGVLACFAVLAAVLLVLQSFGQQIGWGYQMQSPLMITLMIYLFLLIGLNLSGYFEVGARLMGVGNELTNKSGYGGSFFTGVLAAVVATPCTAPFMGTALGFALTQPPVIATTILLSLGFGMALPLLLISIIPALGRILPRPGAWMETFKELLAFPMFVSMVWLLWVLVQQTSPQEELYVMLGLVMTAFSFWLWRKMSLQNKLVKMIVWVMLAALSALPVYVIYQYEKNSGEATTEISQSFTPEKLESLLAEKKPVFVNMTAAWCLTCKYNEGAYFSTKKFKDLLKNNNITYLKGDWTNRNATILNYLKSFDRSGVPLYVFYDKNGKSHVLPQILSNKILFDVMGLKNKE